MKSKRAKDDDLIELDVDHEGRATFKFIGEMRKRGAAFKRQFAWALATDLQKLVKDKIPGGRKYKELRNSLSVGEGPNDIFAVFVNQRKVDASRMRTDNTLIYIKPRRAQDRIPESITVLSNHSPWTMETIPFWPKRKHAQVIQRKVDKRIVDKVNKSKKLLRSKIDNELLAAGHRPGSSIQKRIEAAKTKAVVDLTFEMLSLEFGSGSEQGLAIWRRSLKELIPGRFRSVVQRYKQVRDTIGNSRSSKWRRWPVVPLKVTTPRIRTFLRFQSQLGY